MGKPYSLDRRKRVVAAVETGGLSCNQAAKQFGIGISTAIGWVHRLARANSARMDQTEIDSFSPLGFRGISAPIVDYAHGKFLDGINALSDNCDKGKLAHELFSRRESLFSGSFRDLDDALRLPRLPLNNKPRHQIWPA
jgi:hypothetical protein